jgi:hypothetical protein
MIELSAALRNLDNRRDFNKRLLWKERNFNLSKISNTLLISYTIIRSFFRFSNICREKKWSIGYKYTNRYSLH